jgi:hypothetical protein
VSPARRREIRALLDEDLIPLEFRWPHQRRDEWLPEFIDHLRDFKAQFGHVEVTGKYVSPDGYPLGAKLSSVRVNYGNTPRTVGAARRREIRKELDAFGIRWGRLEQHAYDEEFIERLKLYAAEHGGSLSPPTNYVSPDGYGLGNKVVHAREAYRRAAKGESISPTRAGTIKELDKLGFAWVSQGNRVMTEALVAECRRRHAAGESLAAIADDLGIKKTTIRAAIIGANWQHVPDNESGLSNDNNEIGKIT